MQMTGREKAVVAGGLVVLLLVGVFQFLVRPAMARVRTLERVLAGGQQTLRELKATSEEYVALRAELEGVRRRIAEQPADFAFLSFLDGLAKESGLSGNVASMKPSSAPLNETYVESSVEVRLENITLEQATRFLLGVQSARAPLAVKALQIKAARTPRLLDMTVQVVNLTLAASS